MRNRVITRKESLRAFGRERSNILHALVKTLTELFRGSALPADYVLLTDIDIIQDVPEAERQQLLVEAKQGYGNSNAQERLDGLLSSIEGDPSMAAIELRSFADDVKYFPYLTEAERRRWLCKAITQCRNALIKDESSDTSDVASTITSGGQAWVGYLAYTDFIRSVQSDLRFFRSGSSSSFLGMVRSSCKNRLSTIPKDSLLWRARLGSTIGHESTIATGAGDAITAIFDRAMPYAKSSMKPIPDWQREGRANPCGIPTLYAATTPTTALAEVRPWIGATISLAQLQVTRELKVIDCSKDHNSRSVLDVIFDLSKTMEDGVWFALHRAFATPISKEDEARTYIPTQVFAELFKTEGYDGILYKSLLSDDGCNLALFDLGSAAVINCELHELKSTRFDFASTGAMVHFDE